MTFTAICLDDSVTTCDCCGRTNLKATVLMRSGLDELVHFGRTCAARNSGKTSQQITAEVRHARDMAHGSCGNRLTELRRQGVKTTRDVVREVHALFPAAELPVLIRQWA
jgi:hypothetical protein